MHRPILLFACSLAVASAPAFPGSPGGLIGEGVKRCETLNAALRGASKGEDRAVYQLRRFEDWTAGFVSGLNLAAGEDFSHGVDIPGIVRRVGVHCEDHPTDDVFTALRLVLKALEPPAND
jgi:hypothetical protein